MTAFESAVADGNITTVEQDEKGRKSSNDGRIGTQVKESIDGPDVFFAKLFRQSAQTIEPNWVNGNNDLLDDRGPESGDSGEGREHGTCDESGGESIENHELQGQSKSDESSLEENESTASEVESFHEHSNSERQQSQDNLFDDDSGNDLARNQENHTHQAANGDLYSLLGSPKEIRSNTRVTADDLGFGISKVFGLLAHREQKGLLLLNSESEDDDEEENKNSSGEIRESNATTTQDDYYHDDDLTEPGEYRLERFYPGDDSCQIGYTNDEAFRPNRHDLYGRIHGFGSDTFFGSSSRFGCIEDVPMTSMDVNSSEEPGNFLGGVGKTVNSIAEFIFHQREPKNDTDKERKRMMHYIAELELKLSEKDKEVQTWKRRVEQLQLQIQRNNGDDIDYANCETVKNDTSVSNCEALAEESSPCTEVMEQGLAESETNDGVLIDVTAKQPVFDPLERSKEVNEDLKKHSEYYFSLHIAASAFSADQRGT